MATPSATGARTASDLDLDPGSREAIRPEDQDPKTAPNSKLADAVQEVSQRASLLVREEIELAKAEVTEKITSLAKAAAVGAAAGVFVVAGLIYLLHAASWGVWQLIESPSQGTSNFWLGFLIVAVVLFVLAAVAGLLAFRFFKKSTPPVPTMAIEEGKAIKETISNPPGPNDPKELR